MVIEHLDIKDQIRVFLIRNAKDLQGVYRSNTIYNEHFIVEFYAYGNYYNKQYYGNNYHGGIIKRKGNMIRIDGDVLYLCDGDSYKEESSFTSYISHIKSISTIHASGCKLSVDFTVNDIVEKLKMISYHVTSKDGVSFKPNDNDNYAKIFYVQMITSEYILYICDIIEIKRDKVYLTLNGFKVCRVFRIDELKDVVIKENVFKNKE